MPGQVFLDTNILVYSRDEASPFFSDVVKALQGLALNGFTMCVHQQVLREYAAVATKPAPKGLGAGIERALSDIDEFESAYLVLPEPEGAWDAWKELAKTNSITGFRLHDAYIAAVMSVYGISDILTLNKEDFEHFQKITPVTPAGWESLIQ